MRLLGIVVQDLTYLADRAINAVIGIKKNALAPDFLNDLFPCGELASLLNQEEQNLRRDALQPEHTPAAAQFVSLEVEFEILTEPDRVVNFDRPRSHKNPSFKEM